MTQASIPNQEPELGFVRQEPPKEFLSFFVIIIDDKGFRMSQGKAWVTLITSSDYVPGKGRTLRCWNRLNSYKVYLPFIEPSSPFHHTLLSSPPPTACLNRAVILSSMPVSPLLRSIILNLRSVDMPVSTKGSPASKIPGQSFRSLV